MARIPRKTQKLYASSAGATGITEYGSPASGTPVYSTNLDNIQSTAWLTGWAAAALAGTEIPTFQDFNAIHYVFSQQLGYLLQEGIPEYDTGTEYHQNSIVRKSGTYELYGSKVNTNTGNALPSQTDNTQWQYLGDLANMGATYADNTSSNTGTATDEALTPANFGTQQSKSSSGYQRLPAGVIIQWGLIPSTGDNVSGTITLPIAFPTLNASVITSVVELNTGAAFFAVTAKTASNFTYYYSATVSNSSAGYWFAIGY